MWNIIMRDLHGTQTGFLRRGVSTCPTRLRARVQLIYRSFCRDGGGVYRKYSCTNSYVGHRFLIIKLKLINNILDIDRKKWQRR